MVLKKWIKKSCIIENEIPGFIIVIDGAELLCKHIWCFIFLSEPKQKLVWQNGSLERIKPREMLN